MSRIVKEEWAFSVDSETEDIAGYIERNVKNITEELTDTESVKIVIDMKKGEDTSVSVAIEKDIEDMTGEELNDLEAQLLEQLYELDEIEPDKADEDYADWLMDVSETERLLEEVTAAFANIE